MRLAGPADAGRLKFCCPARVSSHAFSGNGAGISQAESAVMAFGYAFYVVGLLFIIALPLIFLLRPRRDAIPEAHVEVGPVAPAAEQGQPAVSGS